MNSFDQYCDNIVYNVFFLVQYTKDNPTLKDALHLAEIAMIRVS